MLPKPRLLPKLEKATTEAKAKQTKQSSQCKGSQSKGSQSKGSQSKGSQSKGSQSKGSQSKGSQSKGSQSKGSQSKVAFTLANNCIFIRISFQIRKIAEIKSYNFYILLKDIIKFLVINYKYLYSFLVFLFISKNVICFLLQKM
jgi:hypothetical protein